MAECPERSLFGQVCELPAGHEGHHRAATDFGQGMIGESSWPSGAELPQRRLERELATARRHVQALGEQLRVARRAISREVTWGRYGARRELEAIDSTLKQAQDDGLDV